MSNFEFLHDELVYGTINLAAFYFVVYDELVYGTIYLAAFYFVVHI